MMSISEKRCVYCDNSNEEDFKKREHVVPQSFGKFGSKTPVLTCVCDKCNAFFGSKLDQTLARDTLEGIARYKQGLFSRETRVQNGMVFSLKEGDEMGEFGGALMGGVDGMTGKIRELLPQFHILNITTGQYDKFTKDQIKDLKLPDDVYGKIGERKIRVFAPSEEEYNSVLKELNKAGVSYEEGERLVSPFSGIKESEDKLELPTVIEGTIDDVRKRALVKILFNFSAYYIGSSEVLKEEWDIARSFVRFGGATLKGRATNKPFWDGQETDNERFASDSCNLRIENKNGDIVGAIQFYNLLTHEFILVEGYSLSSEREIAYRFTPGKDPYPGIKILKNL